MHELSVTKGILGAVLSGLKPGQKVLCVRMDVGEFHNYDPEWMQKYFLSLAKGTAAEGAELQVKRIPMRFRCASCGEEFSLDVHSDSAMVCPSCGGDDYRIIAGREFYIREMEVEEQG